MIRAGTQLSDRYVLERRIASGGMGEVWLGWDPLLERPVAVKVLLASLVSNAEFITRFRSEARMMAGLRHPGIVQIYDTGRETLLDDQTRDYLVMEYVEGPSVGQQIKAAGRLGVAETLTLVAQAADALQVAHQAGIVHRDVKPSNLLVRPDGTIVLVDFGVARSVDVTGITSKNVLMGSPQYMAPEQVAGEPVAAATDVYGLGAAAYCCLTGRPPFTGESPLAVIAQLLHGRPDPLPGDLPAPVVDLVQRAMDKDPARRFPSAEALARAAREALAAMDKTTVLLTMEHRPVAGPPAPLGWTASGMPPTPAGAPALGPAAPEPPSAPPAAADPGSQPVRPFPPQTVRDPSPAGRTKARPQRVVLIALAAVLVGAGGAAAAVGLLSTGGGSTGQSGTDRPVSVVQTDTASPSPPESAVPTEVEATTADTVGATASPTPSPNATSGPSLSPSADPGTDDDPPTGSETPSPDDPVTPSASVASTPPASDSPTPSPAAS